MSSDLDYKLRDEAVANVDHRHGYTVEFSPWPEEHRAEYDEEEERLRAELQAGGKDQ